MDVFGFGIGIIAGICFFYGVVKKKIYIIKSIIIAIATLLNSRTGLIVYAMAIVLSMIFVFKKGNLKKILTMVIAISVLILSGMEIIKIMKSGIA